MRRWGTVVAMAAAALWASGADSVRGGSSERGTFELELSTRAPGAPTGLNFLLQYRDPEDPEGKPPALTGAAFTLPRGMTIDDGAVPQCLASDAEIRAQGRDACPAESKVGEGTLTAMTGFPGADPVTADTAAYNAPGEIVEVVFFEGTNTVAGIDRLTIEGDRLVAHPPATPGGPPDGRTTIREIRLDIPARVGEGGRPYVTAPPDCRRGRWRARATYEFADGGATTLASTSPCRRPRLRVSVTPTRVSAGKSRVVAVRVRSEDPACVRGARVRLGARSAKTGADGRARLQVRFAKPGRQAVVATKPGCRTGRATVIVTGA